MLAGWTADGHFATLTLHDLTGRRVATLPIRPDGDGRFTATWDGTDANGRQTAAGVYLARLVSADGVAVQRVVLVR